MGRVGLGRFIVLNDKAGLQMTTKIYFQMFENTTESFYFSPAKAELFIVVLLLSRNQSHFLHLQKKSYCKIVAIKLYSQATLAYQDQSSNMFVQCNTFVQCNILLKYVSFKVQMCANSCFVWHFEWQLACYTQS